MADGSTSSAEAVRRTEGRRRITGLDIARAVALLGMMATHLYPIVDDEGTPTLAWSLFAGRSFALFVLLAGVGLALSTGGAQPPRPGRRGAAAASVATRAVLLALIGLALGHVVSTTYVILAYYGAIFLLAVPLLRLSVRALVGAAIGLAVVAPLVMQGLRDHLPDPSYTAEGDYLNPSFASLADPGALVSELLLTGVYPAIPLLVYICAGLAIGRLLAATDGDAERLADLGRRLLVAGVAIAVVAWLASSVLLDQAGGLDQIRQASPELDEEAITDVLWWGPDPTLPTTSPWWLAIRAPHSSTPFDLLHTTGTSMAVLGGLLVLVRSAGPVLRPLAAAGGMTLTLYVLHVLATETGFLVERPTLALLVQAAGALGFAVVWLPLFRQGPLERLVASASRSASGAVSSPSSPADAGGRR